MTITIKVALYQNRVPIKPILKRFDALGGTIGRSENCDLTLPDPNLFISDLQAQIICVSGQYFWKDIGKNPTKIDGIEVARYDKKILNSGANIIICDYELTVETQPENYSNNYFSQPKQHRLETILNEVKKNTAPSKIGKTLSDIPNSDGVVVQEVDDLLNIKNVRDNHNSTQRYNHVAPEKQYLSAESINKWVIAEDYDPVTNQHVNNKNSILSDSLTQNIDSSKFDITPKSDIHHQPTTNKNEETAPSRSTTPYPTNQNNFAEAINLVLIGMGFNEITISSIQKDIITNPDRGEKILNLFGVMLREWVTGTLELLKARSMTSIKPSYETSILANKINPIKTIDNPEEILQRLINNKHHQFKDPKESIAEVIKDLKYHEIALFAGMKETLNWFIENFNPQQIEFKAEQNSGFFGVGYKLLWKTFLEQHNQSVKNYESNFQEVFGDRFITAYENQIEILNKHTSKGNAPSDQ